VTEFLRREVNFGCPFPGCGSPFLTWHHFDPPWKSEQHHRPEGMIALCVEHASYADGDHYTKERLRDLKANPFVRTALHHALPWEPESVTFKIGGFVAFGPRRALAIGGVDVLTARHESDDGRLSFDGNLLDTRGRYWRFEITPSRCT